MTAQLPSKFTIGELKVIAETDHVQCGDAAALACALLAAHEQEPFMYGISDPDGKAHIDEYCVCAEPAPLEDSVNELNYDREEDDELNYTVVPLYTRPAPSIPTVSFYREGIEAAAAWVDAQREAYDNEHGRTDHCTGAFEFGNEAQQEYSANLEEIAEGIRTLYPVSIPADSDYFASLVAAARVRADKAMRKHPQPNYVLNKVAEESGEVIKAVIHYTEGREVWANVENELIDNLAMLIRLVTEGDQVIGFTPPDICRAAMLAAVPKEA